MSNAFHVLFAVGIAWVSLRLSRLLLSRVGNPQVHYFVAMAVVLGTGGGFEIAQGFTTGTPSLRDVVLDGLGGTAGLLFVATVDPRLHLFGQHRVYARWLVRMAALLLLGVGLAPSVKGMRALQMHRAQFPLLASFEHPWEKNFVPVGEGERLTFESPPREFAKVHGLQVAKIVFVNTGKRPPRLKVIDLSGDWSFYSSLDFEIYAPAGQAPMSMTLSLHDDGRMGHDEHFNLVLEIKPGSNSFSIPRELIRTGASNRPMHLDKFHELVLFMAPPPHPVTLYFDHFRLTP